MDWEENKEYCVDGIISTYVGNRLFHRHCDDEGALLDIDKVNMIRCSARFYMPPIKIKTVEEMTIKEHFINYLCCYGGEAEVGQDDILSFEGSDGPDITEKGIDTEKGLIKYNQTQKIDSYIKEGCKHHYGKRYDIPTKYPSMKWSDYYKKYIKS